MYVFSWKLNRFVQNLEIQTDPPGKLVYTESVNQGIIFDTYKRYEKVREEKEKAAEDKENEENEEDVAPPELKPVRKEYFWILNFNSLKIKHEF